MDRFASRGRQGYPVDTRLQAAARRRRALRLRRLERLVARAVRAVAVRLRGRAERREPCCDC